MRHSGVKALRAALLPILVSLVVSPAAIGATTHSGLALGVNLEGITEAPGKSLDSFSSATGVHPSIAMYYQTWNRYSSALLDPRIMGPLRRRGAIPMVTWEPTRDGLDGHVLRTISMLRIADGEFDTYLVQAAREAKRYGHRFFVRFAHEMNGSWMPWAGLDPSQATAYVAAWRHVVTLFREQGATNVRWVWSPNVTGPFNNTTGFEGLYPGNRFVDVVGLDGYNSGLAPNSQWISFGDLFESSYRAIVQLTDKPLIVAETASAEVGGSKAAWIRHLGQTLRTDMPRVRGLIWFDRTKERDWRVDSSHGSLLAFRRLVQSSLFSGNARTLLNR